MGAVAQQDGTSTITASEGQGGKPHRMQAHIPALDGLRGFAATAVVFGHIRLKTEIGPTNAQIGSYSVLLFFILSGFLMGHLYLSQPLTRKNIETYFAARISRIVPLYYAVGLFSFLYSQIDGKFVNYMTAWDGLRHILMSDNVSVFWSIAPEFQFYFLFPIIWWIVQLPPRLQRPIGAVAAAICATIVFFRYEMPPLLVFSKLHIFLLGIGIAFAAPFIRVRISESVAILTQLCAIVILMILIVPPTEALSYWIYLDSEPDKFLRYYNELVRVFAMGICVFAFAIKDTTLSRAVFGNAFARRLGKYSFSIYLLHSPIIYFAEELNLMTALPPYVGFSLILVTTYVISAASFKWLEDPARISCRALLGRIFEETGSRLASPVRSLLGRKAIEKT